MKVALDIDGTMYVLVPESPPRVGDYVTLSDHRFLWRVTRREMDGKLYLLSHLGKRFATQPENAVIYVYRDPEYTQTDHRGEYSIRFI